MKTILIASVSILSLAFTCGDSDKTEIQNGLEADVKEVIEKHGKTADEFTGKLDELLTLDIASQTSGLPSVEAEKKYTKLSSFESLKYEWKSDRSKTMEFSPGNFMDIPLKNTIELSWVKNTTLEQFKHDYHNPTPEELANAKKAMNRKIAEMKSDGKTTNEQGDKAMDIAVNSVSKFHVTEVKNLGDYAVFVKNGIMGVSTKDLKVFYKGLSFTIKADLSDKQDYNDKIAIETARKIISEKL